jgi:VIT1/CCC1 family predicted Fe2+/Mn2+ transporter
MTILLGVRGTPVQPSMSRIGRKVMSDTIPNRRELAAIYGDDKDFVLRIIQPGLAGLMDGSVSTLAPIFATAFATHSSRTVFLIGAASAVGAGISMAFSEGLSDDGELTGRGNPVFRGIVTGMMTFIGGFLHTLPFLIGNVQRALTLAYFVVGVGAGGDCAGPAQVLQDELRAELPAGDCGGRAGVCGGDIDWEFVA